MSEYEVGFGKPPSSGKFKSGQTGNPKGRPKGVKNIAALLDSICNESVMVMENGKSRRLTKKEIAMRQLVTKAMKGDMRAMERLLVQMTAIDQSKMERQERSALFLTTEQEWTLRERLQARSATLLPAMADEVVPEVNQPEAPAVDAPMEAPDA